jgi:hypothetical protein
MRRSKNSGKERILSKRKEKSGLNPSPARKIRERDAQKGKS